MEIIVCNQIIVYQLLLVLDMFTWYHITEQNKKKTNKNILKKQQHKKCKYKTTMNAILWPLSIEFS